MQDFLRRTAVLERLSGPLCDAVLGESGGQERLEALEASNSFLIPLDRRREWYRYHPLFRDFLLGELRRSEPEVVESCTCAPRTGSVANGSPAHGCRPPAVHGRAGPVCAARGRLVPVTYSAGQISTVQRWMAALGDSAIRAYPPLAVLAGWVTALVGETADAQRWAAIVDEASYDGSPPGGPASFASSRAMLRAMMCAAGPEQMMADAAFAAEQETPSSTWRDTALCVLGEAHLLAGDVDRAAAAFEEATSFGLAMGHTDTVVISESELALIAMEDGRWGEAADHVGAAWTSSTSTRCTTTPSACSPSPPRPASPFTTGTWSGPTAGSPGPCGPDRCARSCCRSWRPGAGCSWRRCTRPGGTRPPRGSSSGRSTEYCDTDRCSARWPTRSRSSLGLASATAAGRPGVSPLTSAELRLLPYLQTYLTIAEIAERLRITRNTVGTEVSAIYRKLGVSSRGDAVRQATSLGLLGG